MVLEESVSAGEDLAVDGGGHAGCWEGWGEVSEGLAAHRGDELATLIFKERVRWG